MEFQAKTEGIEKAREHRRLMARSLHEWVGDSAPIWGSDDKRHALDRAWLVEGPGAGAELELTEGSRPVQWRISLEKEAKRLSLCEVGIMLLRDVAKGEWRPKRIGCGSRLCPVCARARAARACGRWRPVLEAAVEDGAQLRHWTFTQPAHAKPGGLVLAHELAAGWVGTLAAPGVLGRATEGEGLLAAYGRVRATLTGVRDDRGCRDVVKAAFGGLLVGVEWTGRAKDSGVPRWHAHVHALGCTPPGVEVDEKTVRAAWCRRSGGAMRAQHVRRVDPSKVAEVLKYPFKASHLSSAERIESLSAMKGAHPHHASGSWHPTSNARRHEPCWNKWLEARPPEKGYPPLHWVEKEGDEPVIWRGAPKQGVHLFALRSPGGSWVYWLASAETYARMADVPLDDDPEPGSDESEDWFKDE